MATRAEQAAEQLRERLGTEDGPGEWFTVTQDVVDRFADVTLDHQFIHVDPQRAAKESPFGGTIAHGFLTLSLLTHLDSTIERDPAYAGTVMGVNYGFDRIRFVSPVPVGSRIRARATLGAVDLKGPNDLQISRTMVVEIEGQERPALVADWLTRLTYA